MRAQVQRVASASVRVDGEVVGAIGAGLLAYVGVAPDDGDADVAYIADKIVHLRIFPDDEGRMNRSVIDAGGDILVVSAFSLYADARHGRRPAFTAAAPPEIASAQIERVIDRIRQAGVRVETGRFRAMMHVESINDGPLCIPLDSRRQF
jgi:D-tyrosyl-tRNA(Tyr) deacylase